MKSAQRHKALQHDTEESAEPDTIRNGRIRRTTKVVETRILAEKNVGTALDLPLLSSCLLLLIMSRSLYFSCT